MVPKPFPLLNTPLLVDGLSVDEEEEETLKVFPVKTGDFLVGVDTDDDANGGLLGDVVALLEAEDDEAVDTVLPLVVVLPKTFLKETLFVSVLESVEVSFTGNVSGTGEEDDVAKRLGVLTVPLSTIRWDGIEGRE